MPYLVIRRNPGFDTTNERLTYDEVVRRVIAALSRQEDRDVLIRLPGATASINFGTFTIEDGSLPEVPGLRVEFGDRGNLQVILGQVREQILAGAAQGTGAWKWKLIAAPSDGQKAVG